VIREAAELTEQTQKCLDRATAVPWYNKQERVASPFKIKWLPKLMTVPVLLRTKCRTIATRPLSVRRFFGRFGEKNLWYHTTKLPLVLRAEKKDPEVKQEVENNNNNRNNYLVPSARLWVV
jgi:hypothetical protein